MRDLILLAMVGAGCLAALRRPWIGVMLWTWLSIMNPHRYSWGIAYDAPLAAAAAASTLLGLLMTRDRASPFKGSPVVWLAVFMLWITLSWLLGLDLVGDYEQWKKVAKVMFMIIVGLALLHEKKHVLALVWVAAGSMALLGLKGGVFSLATGGGMRVWGPTGSFIADNNEFALALVMTIPLLRFLQLQLEPGWRRHAMTAVMIMCAAAALGSQSRGALVALSAMAVVLWLRGKNRIRSGFIIVTAAIALVGFMPDTWTERMSTMENYAEDRSVQGRFSAWWTAWGVAKDHPFGAGFNVARPELVARYSPYPDFVHAAHSIYFQVLGNHGFLGLFIFAGVFVSTYLLAARLRRESRKVPQAAWCEDLGAMAQVSLIGYAVGGTFLSLSYFDLPYNVMMMVVIALQWVRTRGWERDTAPAPGWNFIPGLGRPKAAAAAR